MRETEEWLQQHLKKTGRGYTDQNGKRVEPVSKPAPAATKKKRGELKTGLSQPHQIIHDHAPALGKRKKNKTEARFEIDFLVPAKISGELIDYKFERLKLILGDGTTYLIDYFGWWKNGTLQCWEVKGAYIYEDARVKFNCACEQFPEFAFELVQWKKGEWRSLKKVRC